MNHSKLPFDSKVNASMLELTLKSSNLTNSYKLYWLAAILDEIEAKNKVIGYRKLVDRMVSKCWHSILKYKLFLGRQDMLHKLVQYLSFKYNLTPEAIESDILSKLKNLEDEYYLKAVNELTRYVPYRFIRPFYSERLQGLQDAKINSLIEILNRDDFKCIYILNDKQSNITISNYWYDYIYNNLTIIKGWYRYYLIRYLQAKNPNVPNIINKIKPPLSRDLSLANKIWREVNQLVELKDIYTGEPIIESEMSIDHFIPWSFVQHDMFWNLCPVSRITNSRKCDRLPDLEKHLDSFIDLQIKALPLIKCCIHTNRVILDDYSMIGFFIDSHNTFCNSQFKIILKNTIKPLHQLALNNGFELWS